MSRTCEWEFPLPRTHTGLLQANGTLGTMIWGEKNILRITLGRVDFWDHRGGCPRPKCSPTSASAIVLDAVTKQVCGGF